MPTCVPTAVCLTLLLASGAAFADDPGVVLFTNVRIFDGVRPELTPGSVLVEGRTIARISETELPAPAGATVIDGGGRVLSPGFIDLHAHLTAAVPRSLEDVHPSVVGALAGDMARFYILRGFTTVRDAGGTHPDLARAVELGLITGPRIYPSGAVISQTGGHGDSRDPDALHPALCNCGVSAELSDGFSVLADGVPLWLAATREQLRRGATQIKIMGGGGVASDYDPIHSLQPSPAEIRAAVQAASDWGTYVLAHAYTSEAVQRLVENGVKVIEHGLLIDDETARLVAEHDVVISTQVKIFRMLDEIEGLSEENLRKARQVLEGQDTLWTLIAKYGIKTGFGTDLVFGSHVHIGEEFTMRAGYVSAAEVLRQATSESAEIIRLCGKLNRHGNFGEIREGWVADLILIDGDPLEDISILERAEETVVVVMKDGKLFKNEL
jgi:imidazolonepropionase-like amidohydrolase